MNTLISPTALAEKLSMKKEVLLMMDYDGTLVPITPTPDQARPTAKLLNIIKQLCALPKYTPAVLSGRHLKELFMFLPIPELYLAGSHGAEIKKPDGSVISLIEVTNVKEAFAHLYHLASKCINNYTGFLIENKIYTLAIHYRLANQSIAENVLEEFIEKCHNLLMKYNFELLKGKKVLEVRPKGLHKGKPVSWLRKTFLNAFPVYLGDDTTDEDAFKSLSDHGLSILVSEQPRPTNATLRLRHPSEVSLFLETILSK